MALLNKNFKVVHTPYECKDFLQDTFWCEYSEKKASIYGMNWIPGSIDKDASKFLMYYHGGPEILIDKEDNMQSFINQIEDIQHIPHSIVMPTTDDKVMVVEFDHEWSTLPSFLSAYMTLFRLGGGYTGGDIKAYIDVAMELGSNITPKFSSKDAKNLAHDECEGGKAYYKKALAILKGMRPKMTWADITSVHTSHHRGIMGDPDFPQVDSL